MLIVRFGDASEWLAEIAEEVDGVMSGVVRVTQARRWHGDPVHLDYTLLAGAVVHGSLVLLQEPMGGGFLFGAQPDDGAREAAKRCAGARKELEEGCQSRGLEVRRGVYEWAPGDLV